MENTNIAVVEQTSIDKFDDDALDTLITNASMGSAYPPRFAFSGKDGSFSIKNGETVIPLNIASNPKKASLIAIDLFTWVRGYHVMMENDYLEESASVFSAPMPQKPSDAPLRVGGEPTAPLKQDAFGNELYWKAFSRVNVFGDQNHKMAGTMSFNGQSYTKGAGLLTNISMALKSAKNRKKLMKEYYPVFYIGSVEEKPIPNNPGSYYLPILEFYGWAAKDKDGNPDFSKVDEV